MAEATFVQRFLKSSIPCHVGIHWKALIEYSHMSTNMPGLQSLFMHHFVMTILATTSLRVNVKDMNGIGKLC